MSITPIYQIHNLSIWQFRNPTIWQSCNPAIPQRGLRVAGCQLWVANCQLRVMYLIIRSDTQRNPNFSISRLSCIQITVKNQISSICYAQSFRYHMISQSNRSVTFRGFFVIFENFNFGFDSVVFTSNQKFFHHNNS